MSIFRLFTLIFGMFLAVGGAFAEQDQTNGTATGLSADLRAHLENQSQNPEDDLFPDAAVSAVLDEEGKAALQRSLVAYYDYRTQGFDHRSRVFAWQHVSTKIIFVMVMLIVLSGLYFSWMQFRQNGPETDQVSTVELGKAGVKITSPVLGVVILAVSLGFFYLYLVHVYPIFDTF